MNHISLFCSQGHTQNASNALGIMGIAIAWHTSSQWRATPGSVQLVEKIQYYASHRTEYTARRKDSTQLVERGISFCTQLVEMSISFSTQASSHVKNTITDFLCNFTVAMELSIDGKSTGSAELEAQARTLVLKEVI